MVRGMDLKRAYFRNDSHCYVHFGALTEWNGPVLCSHMVWLYRKCWNFWSKFYHIVATKTYLTVSVKAHGNYLIFCSSSSVYFNASKSSYDMRANVCELFIAMAVKQVSRWDWYASALSRLKFSNTNLKIFFPMIWHINQAFTKWNIKVSKAKSEYGHQYI